jgi:hypothetical protein
VLTLYISSLLKPFDFSTKDLISGIVIHKYNDYICRMYKKIKKILIISSELNINYTKKVLSLILDKDIYKILIPIIGAIIFIISLFTNGYIKGYVYTYTLNLDNLLSMLIYGIYMYTFYVFLLYITRIVRNFKSILLLLKGNHIVYDTEDNLIRFEVSGETYFIESVYYEGKMDASKIRSIKLRLLTSNI